MGVEAERRSILAGKLDEILAAGGALLGHANLVLEALPQGSGSGEDVTRIVQAAQRAGEMTNQMLAYAGRGKFVLARVDLNSLVTQISQLLQVSIPKKVELCYEMAPGLAGINGDPSQIQQVVMNLIINAAEAIGDRLGTITLRTGLIRVPKGEYVHLVVADTGSGMDPATITRIFEPFFTTKFTGRGLGLAAVQGIMRSHRGMLTVDSIPDQGTTFSVFFPAVASTPPPVEPAPESGSVRNGTGTVLRLQPNGAWAHDPTTPAIPVQLSQVRFFDAQHGWIVGQGTILYTEDGGKTWRSCQG